MNGFASFLTSFEKLLHVRLRTASWQERVSPNRFGTTCFPRPVLAAQYSAFERSRLLWPLFSLWVNRREARLAKVAIHLLRNDRLRFVGEVALIAANIHRGRHVKVGCAVLHGRVGITHAANQ